jgi:YbbR domain-containing protein
LSDLLRRRIFHNFGLKLMSLLLAVGLWLAVSRDPVAEVAVEVPIEFHNVPDNLELNSEGILQAQVRIRGPQRIIHRLQPSDVHPEIDLQGAKPGERTFDLTAQQIHMPHDLQVVQVIPSQFHVNFDTRANRDVPVHARVTGNFARGYRIAHVAVDPDHVNIIGPETRVAAVEAAVTDPIDASGIMERDTFTTHAYVSDPLVQVVHPGPIRVTVIMENPAANNGSH